MMRLSSVHSLHCLGPRSYWSPRKRVRYCNHYFIQQPVGGKWGGEHYLLQRTYP